MRRVIQILNKVTLMVLHSYSHLLKFCFKLCKLIMKPEFTLVEHLVKIKICRFSKKLRPVTSFLFHEFILISDKILRSLSKWMWFNFLLLTIWLPSIARETLHNYSMWSIVIIIIIIYICPAILVRNHLQHDSRLFLLSKEVDVTSDLIWNETGIQLWIPFSSSLNWRHWRLWYTSAHNWYVNAYRKLNSGAVYIWIVSVSSLIPDRLLSTFLSVEIGVFASACAIGKGDTNWTLNTSHQDAKL